MSAVRPEFGPTLGEIAGPRVRALPRPVRLGGAALLVLLVLAVVALRLGGGEARTAVVVREGVPTPFNLAYDARLRRVQPAPEGVAVALRSADGAQRVEVRGLLLPPFERDASGVLPVLASQLAGRMAGGYDDFAVRQEGRANINKQQGYELVFQFRREGRLHYGRRVLLVANPAAREGADITLTAPRSDAIPRADAIGRNGGLKIALRSFRFGTERP